MDNSNRINQTTIAQTTQRQTPQNDFGQVMARTVASVVQVGTGVAGGLAMGNPVLSAAVSSATSAISGITGVARSGVQSVGGTPGTTGGASGSGAAGGTGATGGAGEWDLMEAQKLMNAEQRSFNLQYLQLQNSLQQESREFNAVSNIMKVRHDSAKAAINNIR